MLKNSFQERVFPYCSGIATVSSLSDDTTSNEATLDLQHNTPADFLLACIARATCQYYQDVIIKIPEVSSNSAKQLYTDIGKETRYNVDYISFHKNNLVVNDSLIIVQILIIIIISGYLGDILEDLGHPLTDGLRSLVCLLRLPSKEYLSASTEHPQKLVSAISAMRKIS